MIAWLGTHNKNDVILTTLITALFCVGCAMIVTDATEIEKEEYNNGICVNCNIKREVIGTHTEGRFNYLYYDYKCPECGELKSVQANLIEN